MTVQDRTLTITNNICGYALNETGLTALRENKYLSFYFEIRTKENCKFTFLYLFHQQLITETLISN